MAGRHGRRTLHIRRSVTLCVSDITYTTYWCPRVTPVMSPTRRPLSLSECRLCNVSGARWFAGSVVECLLCFPHLAPRRHWWLRSDNKVAMLLRAQFARFLSLLWACARDLKHKQTESHTFRSTVLVFSLQSGTFRTFFVEITQARLKLLNNVFEISFWKYFVYAWVILK